MKWFNYGIVAALFFSPMAVHATEPENFYYSQHKLSDYYQSGRYLADITDIMQQAQQKLQEAVSHRKDSSKLAIVLDVDETSLSNIKLIFQSYSLVYQVGDKVSEKFLQDFEHPYENPALSPTLTLYKYAIKNNVDVFFITGRYEEGREGTVENLHKVGFTHWRQLIMRQADQALIPAADFKTKARKMIAEQGYNIVLNIGDQQSDLIGGYADYAYKVPNPYYFVP